MSYEEIMDAIITQKPGLLEELVYATVHESELVAGTVYVIYTN